MFRLALAVAIVLLLLVQSFFTTTTHVVEGEHHIFRYSALAWVFLGGFAGILAAFAWIAWQPMKDKPLGGFLLAATPLLMLLLAPQLLYERVELTDELLIHRREWPHTEFNVDIPWDQMVSATQVNREDNSFGKKYIVGYEIRTRGGKVHKLPTCIVLTSASETINARLAERKIPTKLEVKVPQPR
jgi:hypothetical protein